MVVVPEVQRGVRNVGIAFRTQKQMQRKGEALVWGRRGVEVEETDNVDPACLCSAAV